MGAAAYELNHSVEYPYLGYDTKFCSKVAYISVALIIILVAALVLAPILINYSHYIDCGASLKESDYVHEDCSFTLLESVPENLTFPASEGVQPSIYSAWLEMVRGAKKSIDIISFYWTMRGVDVVEDPSAAQGETIFNELLQALQRGVSVTIVINRDKFPTSNDTDILQRAGAQVLYLNVSKLLSAGILHTKMWMVDSQVVFVGSANMDWRALTQNLETGVLVKSCSLFAHDAAKVVDTYKYLASLPSLPHQWPCRLKTNHNLKNPLLLSVNGVPSSVVLAHTSTPSPPRPSNHQSSPSAFTPPHRSNDLSSLLHVIDKAREFVYVSVMDYAVSSLYTRPNSFWPDIDNALRRAAFDRKVEVRLLTSLWVNTKSSMINFMRSLSALNSTWKGVSITTKLFCVPAYSESQSSIPYSRVNHQKIMVTEQAAYLTTSNWSEDYFRDTAGVSVLINQTSSSQASLSQPSPSPATPIPPVQQANMRLQMLQMFQRHWFSPYTIDISLYDPSRAYELCNSTRRN